MKRFVEGVDRSQATLFPERPEDWVEKDNPARVSDVFVDDLKLFELGFARVSPKWTGRPFSAPHLAMILWPTVCRSTTFFRSFSTCVESEPLPR